MINVTVPNSYDEITVKQVVELSKIKQPSFFEDYITGVIEAADISVKQSERELPNFYRNVLSVLTGKEVKFFKDVDPYTIRKVFEEKVIGFYCSIIADKFTDCKEVKSFKIGVEEYFLPSSKEQFGNILHMNGAYFGQWTDVMDTLNIVAKELEGGMFEAIPQLISILCLRKGEEYNEDVCLGRASIFNQLKYSEVRYVFFLLFRLTNLSNMRMLTSIHQLETEAVQMQLKERESEKQQ